MVSTNRYEILGEKNYAAKVIRVRQLVELPGLDNLRGVPVDGYMALVSKDTPLDSLMVMFPAETQLDRLFAANQNLFRHSELNADPEAKGYLEDSARVRAIKFRGHISSALLLPAWAPDMAEGLEFDTINGATVSRKYVVPVKGNPGRTAAEKAWKRVDSKFLPEHPDTSQYLREQAAIPETAWFTVTQKLHGTSIRFGRTVVKRQLSWWERLLVKWGVKIADHEYDLIAGSRKVIKDPKSVTQNHHYGVDLWTSEAVKYADLIPSNVVVYGELIGWVPGTETPIQKNYTYDVPKSECHLYVYRVSVVTEDAKQYDLGDAAMREFCAARGLNVVPKLWEGYKWEFEPEHWTDKRFADQGFFGAVPLAKESPVDEGVCIRIEGIIPKIFKLKGPEFFLHESATLDTGEADLETEGALDS